MLFGIFFTFAIANSAASRSTIPDTNTSGLEAFIHRCLHGKVEGATLTVSGIDTNKHGIRNHVELTFYLNGSKGDCDIILRPPDQGRFVISVLVLKLIWCKLKIPWFTMIWSRYSPRSKERSGKRFGEENEGTAFKEEWLSFDSTFGINRRPFNFHFPSRPRG